MEAFIPKHGGKLGEGFSRQEKLNAMAHPGRQANPKRGYQSAVSFISDLISLRKIIILCSFCRGKFSPRLFAYRRMFVPDHSGKTDGYSVNGNCDSCKGFTFNLGGGTGYVPEEIYSQAHVEPLSERHRARAAAKELGVWVAVQRQQRQQ